MRRTRCNGKRGYFISYVSDEEEEKSWNRPKMKVGQGNGKIQGKYVLMYDIWPNESLASNPIIIQINVNANIP